MFHGDVCFFLSPAYCRNTKVPSFDQQFSSFVYFKPRAVSKSDDALEMHIIENQVKVRVKKPLAVSLGQECFTRVCLMKTESEGIVFSSFPHPLSKASFYAGRVEYEIM